MIEKDEKPIRGFHWYRKAWYSRGEIEKEIGFGLYYINDGCAGEMVMEWENLGGKNVPRFHVYDDGWKALASFTDLIQKLGEVDDENITQEQFVEILLSCGFTDMTPYERKEM